MMIINPGSDTLGGTYEDAEKEAKRLGVCMQEDGITDIILFPPSKKMANAEGRFLFTYKHKITGKTGTWELTGLEQNYKEKGFTFAPRIYWNGCSSSSPEWKDFTTEEYELTVRKKPINIAEGLYDA